MSEISCFTFQLRRRDDAVGCVQEVQEVGRVARQHQGEEPWAGESNLILLKKLLRFKFTP